MDVFLEIHPNWIYFLFAAACFRESPSALAPSEKHIAPKVFHKLVSNYYSSIGVEGVEPAF
jgi:hypothetical protein